MIKVYFNRQKPICEVRLHDISDYAHRSNKMGCVFVGKLLIGGKNDCGSQLYLLSQGGVFEIVDQSTGITNGRFWPYDVDKSCSVSFVIERFIDIEIKEV